MMFVNDRDLFLVINSACAVFPDLFWMSVSALGTGWMIFALTLPSILFAPRIFYAVLITAPIAGGLSRVTKLTLSLPRPPAVLDTESFHLIGQAIERYSMPSGHTLAAFAAASCIYFSVKKAKCSWVLPIFLLAGLIGLARIAIGVHWPEDVLVGSLMGFVAGFLGARLAGRLPHRLLQFDSPWLRLCSCWGLLCFYALLTERLDFVENRPIQWAAALLVALVLARFWYLSALRPRLSR